MKNLILTALTVCLLFSCKKATMKPPEHNELSSGIESQTVSGDTSITTYQNSDIVAKVVLSSGKTFIVRGDKTIEAFAKLTTDQEGIRTFSMSDKEGNLYYSIKVNKENQLGYLNEQKAIPLELLFQHSGIQSVNNISGNCMQEAFKTCNGNWGCYLACETTLFGLAGCTIGWKIGCKLIN